MYKTQSNAFFLQTNYIHVSLGDHPQVSSILQTKGTT